MVVFNCEYRVVVTLLKCVKFIVLDWMWLCTYWVVDVIRGVHWYLQMLYSGGALCCRVMLWWVLASGGTCGWVMVAQLLLLCLGCFFFFFYVVCHCTGCYTGWFVLISWLCYGWTLYSGIALVFRAVNTDSCRICYVLCWNLNFWDFEEWANRANIFPVFLDWSEGSLDIVCTQYTLESESRCVQNFEVAGGFGPVFVEGKVEYFK